VALGQSWLGNNKGHISQTFIISSLPKTAELQFHHRLAPAVWRHAQDLQLHKIRNFVISDIYQNLTVNSQCKISGFCTQGHFFAKQLLFQSLRKIRRRTESEVQSHGCLKRLRSVCRFFSFKANIWLYQSQWLFSQAKKQQEQTSSRKPKSHSTLPCPWTRLWSKAVCKLLLHLNYPPRRAIEGESEMQHWQSLWWDWTVGDKFVRKL